MVSYFLILKKVLSSIVYRISASILNKISATVKMTVDGGTSQWDSFIRMLPQEDQRTIQLPDLVTGDFDSITEELLQKYKTKGCKVNLKLYF